MNNLVNSNVFQKQIDKLLKKYVNINNDLKILDSNFEFESFSDLGNGFRKYRVKNLELIYKELT